MFTGIIERLGKVVALEKDRGNLDITLQTDLAGEVRIDQSIAHNGVCLTVVDVHPNTYLVTAIAETLGKTNLGQLSVGSFVNLERAMILGTRLDGHLVQGHVDQTGNCTGIDEQDGSWLFHFEYEPSHEHFTIQKGSVTIDGTSLTVVDSGPGRFSVAIIPYTYKHTCFHTYKVGSVVNLEFDLIGKYVARIMENRLNS